MLPVRDADEDSEWGVCLSKANFVRIADVYEPTTLDLKTNLHTQELGVRPLIELEPTDHPLAVEQREGITVARVQELAEIALRQ